MERKDIQALFTYIRELHPHCPPDKIPKLSGAVADTWIEALAGYTLEDAKRAARRHAQKCRFWPSMSEVLVELPTRVQRTTAYPLLQADEEQAQTAAKYHRLLRTELDKLGLPNSLEAEARGMSYQQWRRMAEEAGVDFAGLLVGAYTERMDYAE